MEKNERRKKILYATTPSERRLILRTASNSHLSAGKIKEKCGVNARVATVKGRRKTI